jgi:protein-disulfide isomerase
MAGACGYAPDDAAPEKEIIAPAEDRAPAAAAPIEAAECDLPPEGCDCDQGAAGESPEEKIEKAAIEDVPVGAAATRGPANAPVTIVVFSDFQCPFCAKAAGTLEQLDQEYPGKLRIAFKHNPLPFHAEGRVAARAALAAQAQGRFWEYHDALFQGARAGLGEDALERHAADAGLDAARLGRDMRSPGVEAALAADQAEAARLKIAGTPTLFVNGRRVIGAQPIEVLRAAVSRALAER